MAAKFVNKPTNTHISGMKRTVCPPRVAMAARTAEVRAVGAWVQPEPVRVHSYYEAVVGFPRKFSSHYLSCFKSCL